MRKILFCHFIVLQSTQKGQLLLYSRETLVKLFEKRTGFRSFDQFTLMQGNGEAYNAEITFD